MTERMTAAELQAAVARPARPQRVMGAKRTMVDGITFDSAKEARRWQELRLLERAGEIAELERQVPIPLNGRDGPVLTPTGRQMLYLADFQYRDHRLGGAVVIEDVKSGDHRTEVYQIKRAVLAAQGVEVSEI